MWTPQFLIVPAERETAAEILLANASRKVSSETRWKIRHVAGAKAIDFRGMVKMPISG